MFSMNFYQQTQEKCELTNRHTDIQTYTSTRSFRSKYKGTSKLYVPKEYEELEETIWGGRTEKNKVNSKTGMLWYSRGGGILIYAGEY